MKVLLLVALALLFNANLCIAAGGQKPYNTTLTDPLAVFAIQEINKFFNSSKFDDRPREVLRIVNATSQVVAGKMYRFRIEVSVKKNQSQLSDKELCTVAVWSRLWLPDAEKTALSGPIVCVPKNS